MLKSRNVQSDETMKEINHTQIQDTIFNIRLGFQNSHNSHSLYHPWLLSSKKNTPANTGDAGLIPGWGRYLRKRSGNSLLYSWLGNPMKRRTWWAIVPACGHKSVNHLIILKNSNQGLWKNYKEQGMYTTREAWWATVHGITKASEKTQQLKNNAEWE